VAIIPSADITRFLCTELRVYLVLYIRKDAGTGVAGGRVLGGLDQGEAKQEKAGTPFLGGG
jgi:hypothetical protein